MNPAIPYNLGMSGLVTLGRGAPLDQEALGKKQDHLLRILRDLGQVLVAYSGGTDSAYLAWAAAKALGSGAIAVTADSPSIPESHKRDAIDLAEQFGFRHKMIPTGEFDNEAYAANNPDRCFHCKDELFSRMEELAREFPHHVIVYGVNKDDLGDYRPGQNAARIHEVKAPLVEAGLTKAEIRELSRLAGLPTWDRPAAACLSSRIPYGTRVTPERIRRVEMAEENIKALGFLQFRVRYQDETARIELAREEMAQALSLEVFAALSAAVKRAGFRYASLDLDGYRQGAMNEVLDLESK
jgi:uncharacterized protein